MVNMVSSMDRDKTKECVLCEQMLTDLLPRDREELGPDFYTEDSRVDPKSLANSFTLYKVQVSMRLIFCLYCRGDNCNFMLCLPMNGGNTICSIVFMCVKSDFSLIFYSLIPQFIGELI